MTQDRELLYRSSSSYLYSFLSCFQLHPSSTRQATTLSPSSPSPSHLPSPTSFFTYYPRNIISLLPKSRTLTSSSSFPRSSSSPSVGIRNRVSSPLLNLGRRRFEAHNMVALLQKYLAGECFTFFFLEFTKPLERHRADFDASPFVLVRGLPPHRASHLSFPALAIEQTPYTPCLPPFSPKPPLRTRSERGGESSSVSARNHLSSFSPVSCLLSQYQST